MNSRAQNSCHANCLFCITHTTPEKLGVHWVQGRRRYLQEAIRLCPLWVVRDFLLPRSNRLGAPSGKALFKLWIMLGKAHNRLPAGNNIWEMSKAR